MVRPLLPTGNLVLAGLGPILSYRGCLISCIGSKPLKEQGPRFEDDEEPANWLEPGTGPAEHLWAQTEEGQGNSSQSGEVKSPLDQSGDTDSENLVAEEFDDRQDPEVDPEEDSQVIGSGEEEKLPYRRSRRQRRAPNRLNLRVKAGILDGFSLRQTRLVNNQ